MQAEGQEFDSPHLHHPDLTSGSLFFENCIEEGNERKIFHMKCFSDVPKEISKETKPKGEEKPRRSRCESY